MSVKKTKTVEMVGEAKPKTFQLGDRVKTKSGKGKYFSGGLNGTGTVTAIMFYNSQPANGIVYQVKESTGGVFSYDAEMLTQLRTQTLFGYIDSTEEVHWATKKYTDKELAEFGFTAAPEFNKSIDLE